MGWSRSTDRWGGRGWGDMRCQLDEVVCPGGGGHGDHHEVDQDEVDHHDQHGQPGEDRRMEPIAGPPAPTPATAADTPKSVADA